MSSEDSSAVNDSCRHWSVLRLSSWDWEHSRRKT